MKTIMISEQQFELIMTALAEKEFQTPKNHPARKNYRDLRDYLKYYGR